MKFNPALFACPALFAFTSTAAAFQANTTQVSVSSTGVQANQHIDIPAISSDGRFVAFTTNASSLIVGDTNGLYDVFIHDRHTGTTELVSVSSAGVQGNDHAGSASMSGDGRFVAFDSRASNLVAGDTNGTTDIFVRDRQTGNTQRVSIATGGAQANFASGGGYAPKISTDGRFVAFHSLASNLVGSDTNGSLDVFVRDLQSGTTERVSVSSANAPGNAASGDEEISADGRFVVFGSTASNLVSSDTNGAGDVFIRDRLLGTTKKLQAA